MTDVQRYDITVHQGETWSMTVTVKDENENPKNLSGYIAKMQVRRTPGGELLLSLSSPGSGISLSGSAGELTCNLSASETAGAGFNKGLYDLGVQDPGSPGSPVNYFLKGDFNITPRITEF